MRLKLFKHPYFIAGSVFCFITLLIFGLGNPALLNGWLYWHFFPEMIGLFFFGMFYAVMGASKKSFILFLVLAVGCTFLGLAAINYQLLTAETTVNLEYMLVILSPTAVGFAVERKRMEKVFQKMAANNTYGQQQAKKRTL